MSFHHRSHTAVIRSFLFVWLLLTGSTLIAQQEEARPVLPPTEAPHKSNETPDDSELKIQVYLLKHAQAADVLKLFKKLYGVGNGFAIDERTNSIVFLARESAATEILETLALLDGETPSQSSHRPQSHKHRHRKHVFRQRPNRLARSANTYFKHAKAADVLKILREVAGSDFNDDMEGFVVDERTNSFIWKINDVSLNFEEECRKLDIESRRKKYRFTTSSAMDACQSLAQRRKAVHRSRSIRLAITKCSKPCKRPDQLVAVCICLTRSAGNNVRIVKEKIADYVDPPRFVPLIGMAQLHHAHYKCTIYFSDRTDKDANEVMYIDHNHFHLSGNGPVPGPPARQAPQTFNFSMGFERGESLQSLKQRYSELEQQTHELADKLKQSKSPSEPERKELQAAVRKSFEARQALQRAELADLAQRMNSMQQSIDMRDKLADKVVERRVEDLLNPNLKWDLLAAKERTLDGPNSESTPGGSASLPPSMVRHLLVSPTIQADALRQSSRKGSRDIGSRSPCYLRVRIASKTFSNLLKF